MPHPIPASLSEKDRASLQTFIHTGKANARNFTRAHALLKAADSWTDTHICQVFGITRNTSIQVRQRYLSGGLEAVLHDQKQQRLSYIGIVTARGFSNSAEMLEMQVKQPEKHVRPSKKRLVGQS
jgi:Homeodomain-like domain-containing protein